MGELLGTLSMV